MTGFNNNNNNKFVPVAPKTYEVRYVENKQSGLSSAARNKVISRSGSNYLSERTTIINPSYGPGFWDDVGDWIDRNAPAITIRATIAAVSVVNPPAGAALAVGMAGGGIVASVAGECSGSDDARETGRVLISGSNDKVSRVVANKVVDIATNLNK